MALTAFLKIPDIPGESQAAEHEDEIDILGVAWGIERNGVRRGTRRSRGRSVTDPMTVQKRFDKASPYIALAVHQGKVFDEIVFSVRKQSGDAHLDYLVITMTNCQITDYEMAHIDGETPEQEIREQVEIVYEKIEVLYTETGSDGSVEGEHEVAIDTVN